MTRKRKKESESPESDEEDPESQGFFREIEEELRNEELLQYWKRWGPGIIAAVVAILLAVAGYQGWEMWRGHRQQVESQRFQQAQQTLVRDGPAAAAEAFNTLAQDGSTGQALLARFRAAALWARAGEESKAVNAYKTLARADAPRRYRQLARVLAGQLRADSADPRVLRSDLGPIADGKGAWRHLAAEVLGVAAYRAGDMERARRRFTTLADARDAPEAMRERAREMLIALDGAGGGG